jgi:hypothetical protein
MDTRILLIIGVVGFAAIGVANSIWFGLQLKNYANRTASLESDLDLFRFKKMVAKQMYAALAQIVVLSAPIVIFIAGIMFEALRGSDIVYVIVPSVVIIILGGFFRGWEKHVRSVPAATPELAEQRDAVVRTWLRKALPDW